MKRLIKNAGVKKAPVTNFDKSFNSGFFWAVESENYIDVTIIQMYYTV
jgi:hypothetical protein